MKYLKILGLAAIAMAALLVMAGSASATTLTSPEGTIYTSAIRAENEGPVTLTSGFGGFGTVSCNKSTIEGKVETHGSSVTAGGKINGLTFTECTGGTPTSPVINRGSLEVHHGTLTVLDKIKEGVFFETSFTGGTLTSRGAEVIVHGTALGTCVFNTNTATDLGFLTTTNTTAGKGTIDIKATLASTCGNGTWEGSYNVTTPGTIYVDA